MNIPQQELEKKKIVADQFARDHGNTYLNTSDRPDLSTEFKSRSISSSVELIRRELEVLYNTVSELKSRLSQVIKVEPCQEPAAAPPNVDSNASGLQCQIGNMREIVGSIQYIAESIHNSLDIE